LRAGIRDVERRIGHRQDEIGVALDSTLNGVTRHLKTRLVSPGALLAAGLLGAAIQRDHRLRGLRILAILRTADAGLRLLLTATSRPKA
jgi:hypothetical protein